jgi:hypothetical protein
MASFEGRLRLLGHTGFPLGVEVDLSGERMVVSAGETQLANWALSDITISSLLDGFHISAEGEEVVLNVTDATRFAVEIRRGRARPTAI